MVAQALQLIAVAAAMVVERGLGLGGAIARDGEFGAEIFELEIQRDSARGDSGVGDRGRVLERVECAAAHRAAVLFGDFEIAAAARIDIAGRALDENRDWARASGGGGRSFRFRPSRSRANRASRAGCPRIARRRGMDSSSGTRSEFRSARYAPSALDFGVGRAGAICGDLNLTMRTHQAAIDSERELGGSRAERRWFQIFVRLNDRAGDLLRQRALPFEVAAFGGLRVGARSREDVEGGRGMRVRRANQDRIGGDAGGLAATRSRMSSAMRIPSASTSTPAIATLFAPSLSTSACAARSSWMPALRPTRLP